MKNRPVLFLIFKFRVRSTFVRSTDSEYNTYARDPISYTNQGHTQRMFLAWIPLKASLKAYHGLQPEGTGRWEGGTRCQTMSSQVGQGPV